MKRLGSPGRIALRLLLSLWLPCSWAAAQQLDFHPPALASDPTAGAVMRDLAERVLPVYQEDNPQRYLANLSALQLLAGSYAAATESRQSLRERRLNIDSLRPDGRATLYDIYTQAKAFESSSKLPFAQAFTQTFHDALAHMSDQSAYAVTSWRAAPVSALQDTVQSAFNQHRDQGSISVSDAVELARAYLSFEVFRNIAPLLPALDSEDDQRRYTAEDRVQVKTAGGGSITVRLIRPRSGAEQRLPALLEFTIYLNSPSFAKECASHGYVGVVAYTRETPQDIYRVAPFANDGEDARAVIDWIARQPWSDGRVGMYGGNYSGFTQWAAARKLPAALKAIATSSPMAPGIDFPLRGSIFRNSAYRWAYNVTHKKGWDDTYNDERWRSLEEDWYRSGKSYFEFDHTDDKPNRFFHSWLHHPSYDRFWQLLVPYREQFAHVNIPVLTTAGYYGADEVGALWYFEQHHQFNPQADQTLLIGPYDDSAMERAPTPVVRGYQLDPVAMVDLRELRYQWFDYVFKGAPKPAILSDHVNFEVMGANEWRHAASLAAMAAGSQRFFLSAAPDAHDAHQHLLAQHKGADKSFIRQSVSMADRSDADWLPPASVVGRELPVHNSVQFISEPLQRASEISGLLSGRLDFTINRMDVDLNIALYEVLPGGDYLALYDPVYAFRASYAHDRVHRHLLKAGERQQLAFRGERLTSRRLEAGSRIAVVLGVNKRPDEQINYGGGDDVSAEALEDDDSPLNIRWYGGSYIDLPMQEAAK